MGAGAQPLFDASGNPITGPNGGQIFIGPDGQPIVDSDGNTVVDSDGNPVTDVNGNPVAKNLMVRSKLMRMATQSTLTMKGRSLLRLTGLPGGANGQFT
ncbi:MAG: hypothetical protein HC767_13405, partial [Akkermansiaceae bacterium]|nr:hypothetical protein [Akkermansiaceae bacterium]